MFKGLKSKLEDEAKRLQQYGENLASQVRSTASEAGSDISGKGKKLLEGALTAVQQQNHGSESGDGNADTSLIGDEFTPSSTRQRRLSNDSLESNESSFSNLNLPPHAQPSSSLLETISSDVESNAGSVADLSTLDGVPSDKLTSIFQRLQGRAVDYKQKYRELIKAYREIERENEKCRSVLSSTQDKALNRISKLKEEKNKLHDRLKTIDQHEAKVEKLQDLLGKCKNEITANRERISTLMEENENLKKTHGDEQTSVDRVSAEWKGRFDRQEEEWTKRMASCEEKAAIAIATSKAEMHSALQQKDQELEKWISKFHAMEKKDEDKNVQWKEKVDGLQKAIVALEQEKADMVHKLSQAKQEGVKLVKESEEKRHTDILAAELKKKDEEWSRKMKEVEEQMQLAIEEHDLQKKTSAVEYDRVIDKLRQRIEEVEKENARVLLELKRQGEELQTKGNKIEELLSKGSNEEMESTKHYSALEEEKKRNVELEGKMKELIQEKESQMKLMEQMKEEKASLEAKLAEKEEQLRKKTEEIQELATKNISNEETGRELEKQQAKLEEEQKRNSDLETKIQQLQEQNLHLQQNFEDQKKAITAEYDREIDQLRKKIEEAEKKKDEELQTKGTKIDELLSKGNDEEGINSTMEEEKKRISELEGKMKELIQEREAQMKLMEQMKEEKASLKSNFEQSVTELEAKLAEQKEQLQKKTEEIQELTTKSISNEETRMELEKYGAMFEEEQKHNSDLEAKLAEQKEQLRKKTEEIQELTSKNINNEEIERELENQLARFEEEQKRNSDLEAKIHQLEEQNLHMQLNFEDQKKAIAVEYDQEMDKLRQRIEEREKENSRISMELKELGKELQNKDKAMEELTRGNTTINEEAMKELENQKARLTEEQQRSSDFESKIQQLEEQNAQVLEEKDQTIANLRTKEEESLQQMSKLEQDLEESRNVEKSNVLTRETEVKELQAKLSTYEEEKIHLSLEIKAANNELKQFRQLEGQFREKVAELEKLHIDLDAMEKLKEEAVKEMNETKKRLVDVQEAQVKAIENAKKTADKAKQKAIADLQSEIRQLYNSINEKDCELAANHAAISKLEGDLAKLRAVLEQHNKKTVDHQHSKEQYNSFTEALDLDEFLELKRKLADQESELQRLKANQQESNGVQKKREFRPQTSIASDHLNFAEPTEAEYLRNVIFRYLTERETLGRESVTLAKVICTVCKFPLDQMNLVLRREEARCQSWLPASVADIRNGSSTAAQIVHRFASSGRNTINNRLEYDRM